MRRTLSIVLLGAICGVCAHVAWLSALAPKPAVDLAAQLSWMKRDLQLSDVQLQQIKALHEASAPRLLALAAQIEGVQGQLAEYEKKRQLHRSVDFLAFARFVEQGRQLDRECVRSTQQLVAAATDVMTPQQRQRYLALLAPALKSLQTNPSS